MELFIIVHMLNMCKYIQEFFYNLLLHYTCYLLHIVWPKFMITTTASGARVTSAFSGTGAVNLNTNPI